MLKYKDLMSPLSVEGQRNSDTVGTSKSSLADGWATATDRSKVWEPSGTQKFLKDHHPNTGEEPAWVKTALNP